jgi:hypothetical protein
VVITDEFDGQPDPEAAAVDAAMEQEAEASQ